MGIPIIVGSSEKLERTGATLLGECPGCGGVQKFYEAKKKFNVTVFFTVSLWDSEELVVQCGQCLACFEHGSIKSAAAPAGPTLRERVTQALGATKAERKKSDDDDIAAELAAMKRRLKR